MKNVEYDAYLTASSIYQSVLSTDNFTVVNIAKTETNKTFNYPSISEIPWSYGYVFDNVPRLLVEHGVIISKINGLWYTNKGLNKSNGNYKDEITLKAVERKYFDKDEHAEYYIKYREYPKPVDRGPQPAGLYSCLIDIDKLVHFINFYNFYTPKFDISTGVLRFLDSVVKFEGEYQIKAVELLINNINKRISPGDFYKIPRGLKNYKGTPPQMEASKKLIKEIRAKIEENDFLSKGLICVQNKGFGIFIDVSIYASFPQKT
jgi:hypothetical protein